MVLLRGIVTRNLSMGFVGMIAAAVLILPPLMLVLITSTDIGERILTHLYVDDSAEVRNIQWLVLNHLNLHDVLFGVPLDRLDVLKYQIGLGEATTDIENFWLLMFLNLGVMGFVVFLVALGAVPRASGPHDGASAGVDAVDRRHPGRLDQQFARAKKRRPVLHGRVHDRP